MSNHAIPLSVPYGSRTYRRQPFQRFSFDFYCYNVFEGGEVNKEQKGSLRNCKKAGPVRSFYAEAFNLK